MCGYPCGYVIEGDEVGYDPGCYCTGGHGVEPRSFQNLADHINLQTTDSAKFGNIRDRSWRALGGEQIDGYRVRTKKGI